MREIAHYETADGPRFRVRYRLGTRETSETFRRRADAETFVAILGDGRDGRTENALRWLNGQQVQRVDAATFGIWFDTYVRELTAVTPRTREDYRSLGRRYLSGLDPLPLNVISRSDVAAIVNRMEADGRAPKTIKQAIHLLSTCLQVAVDDGVMNSNPCRKVRLPSQQIGGTEARFLTAEEVAALHEALPGRYQPLLVFLVGTGMRWSEATAIQGRHVDLNAGTIRVEQAWKRVPGSGVVLGPPKTPKSRRTVNPAVAALAVAEAHITKPTAFLFETASGGVVRHANFYNNVWRPACKRAGLDPWPRIHDSRHTHASWLISEGISLEAVQDQLGHESILTTRAVYGHLLPAVGVAVGKAASETLARALPGIQPPQVRALARVPD